MKKRAVAKRVRISDITGGIFKTDEESNRQYLITPFNEEVIRVNIVGIVLEKFISEMQNYGFIIVNDVSDSIRVKFFHDDLDFIKDIEIGDIVTVVGKVKEYNGEIYINGELCRKVDLGLEIKRKNRKNFKIKKRS